MALYAKSRLSSDTRLQRGVALGSGQKRHGASCCPASDKDIPDAEPLQYMHRSLNHAPNPFHTTYDIVGNVLTATDANGVTITNTYDKANRVTTRTYSDEPAGQTTPAVSFSYDGQGLDSIQSPNNFAKGKLTKVANTVS
jgi:YD repeat-containing protein